MSAEAKMIEHRLRAHVAAVSDADCIWGKDDCSRWAADWAEARLGRSLDLPAYASEAEARSMIERRGSLLALWTGALARAGVPEGYRAGFGDVGVLDTVRHGQVGVIFTHDGIALWRALRGVICLRPRPASILGVWSLA